METMQTQINPYKREYAESLTYPGKRIFAISPSDNSMLEQTIKRMRVTNTSDHVVYVRLCTTGGDVITLPYPPGIWWEELQIQQVFKSGTSSNLFLHGISDNGAPVIEYYDDGAAITLDFSIDDNSIWIGIL